MKPIKLVCLLFTLILVPSNCEKKTTSSLHHATGDGDIRGVKLNLSSSADVNTKEKYDNFDSTAQSTGNRTGGLRRRLKDMPVPREQHGFESLNGILYVVCGQSAPRTHRRDVYAYNINTNNWTTRAPAPIALQSPVMRAVNNRLYLIGGYDSTIPLKYDTTFEYDPAADARTRKANMPTAREDMASAVVDGKIYVFAGEKERAIANRETLVKT